VTEWRHR